MTKQELVKNGIKKTIDDFSGIKAECEKWLKGKLVSIEGFPSEVAERYDYEGIDYLCLYSRDSVPVTSRFRHYDNYSDFTPRKSRGTEPLEYYKWSDARKKRATRDYPKIMIQAYERTNGNVDVGIAVVDDILDYIDSHPNILIKPNSVDGTLFYVVPWDDLGDKMIARFTINKKQLRG